MNCFGKAKNKLPCRNQLQALCQKLNIKSKEFFKLINHFISLNVAERMLEIFKNFQEQWKKRQNKIFTQSMVDLNISFQTSDNVRCMQEKLMLWDGLIKNKKKDMKQKISEIKKQFQKNNQQILIMMKQAKKINADMFQRQSVHSKTHSNSSIEILNQQKQRQRQKLRNQNKFYTINHQSQIYKVQQPLQCKKAEKTTNVSYVTNINQQKYMKGEAQNEITEEKFKNMLQEKNLQIKKVQQQVESLKDQLIKVKQILVQNSQNQQKMKEKIVILQKQKLNFELKLSQIENQQINISDNFKDIQKKLSKEKNQTLQLRQKNKKLQIEVQEIKIDFLKLKNEKTNLEDFIAKKQNQHMLQIKEYQIKLLKIKHQAQIQQKRIKEEYIFDNIFLFDSKVIRNSKMLPKVLENKKVIYSVFGQKKIKKTTLLYTLDSINPHYCHEYIKDKNNILVLALAENETIVGGFAPYFENKKDENNKFSIFSLRGHKDQPLLTQLTTSKALAVQKSDNFFTFGSSQLRFKALTHSAYTNVGGFGSIYKDVQNRYISSEQFIGSSQRDFNIVMLQMYQISFD